MVSKKNWALVILWVFLMFVFTAIVVSDQATANNSKTEEVCGGAVESASKYDVSYLEAWCGEPVGTVRMIAGWYADKDTIETEDGNLWALNTESINEWELLLIWFDDMGTPQVEDDQIIKVWSEVYD